MTTSSLFNFFFYKTCRKVSYSEFTIQYLNQQSKLFTFMFQCDASESKRNAVLSSVVSFTGCMRLLCSIYIIQFKITNISNNDYQTANFKKKLKYSDFFLYKTNYGKTSV